MNSYKLCLLCVLFASTVSCSSVVSKYFDSTQYVRSFNTYIVNDSLSLSLKTPGDIYYERDKEKVISEIKNTSYRLDGLLAYGKTQVPPRYTVYLMLNPKRKIVAHESTEMVRDTLIGSHKLVILCQAQSTSNQSSYREDCQRIFKSISMGQDYRKKVVSLFDLSKQFGNRYYQGLKRITNYPVKNRNEKWIRLQMALNYASFLAPNDIYKKLLNEFHQGNTTDSTKQIIRSNVIQGITEAFKKLTSEAEKHQLIMVNENHFYPNHRILVSNLLNSFKKKGFNYLALEALGAGQDSLLNAGAPPTLESGFYTREPHFAELIREAQRLGYILISYENTDPVKNREVGQADNLFNKTFAKDKSAKVLVLAGFSHILEKKTRDNHKWLAYILYEKYNIDPLTVSQSHLSLYHRMGRPVALVPGNAFKERPYNSVDWLLLNNLPIKDSDVNYRYLNQHNEQVQISLFLTSELEEYKFHSITPFRSGLVKPGKSIEFHLPKEDYLKVIYDERGDILEKEKLLSIEIN